MQMHFVAISICYHWIPILTVYHPCTEYGLLTSICKYTWSSWWELALIFGGRTIYTYWKWLISFLGSFWIIIKMMVNNNNKFKFVVPSERDFCYFLVLVVFYTLRCLMMNRERKWETQSDCVFRFFYYFLLFFYHSKH